MKFLLCRPATVYRLCNNNKPYKMKIKVKKKNNKINKEESLSNSFSKKKKNCIILIAMYKTLCNSFSIVF